jgi:hypothetical protein
MSENLLSIQVSMSDSFQTLTAGEAEYVAALADYEAKRIKSDAYYVDVVQPAQTASDDAYKGITPTL